MFRGVRRALALLALSLPAALLAACGGDGAGDTASSATGAAPPSASASEASYPVTIEHARGQTTIEERPERIVSLNVQWTDAVLAMGQRPVAYVLDSAGQETEPYPWHAEQVAASTRIDAAGTVPFEQIASQRPDLILVTYLAIEQDVFDQLAAIAPTIGMLGDLDVDTWQSQVEVMGRVLGEPARAAAVIADVEGQIDGLAAELPGLDGKTYVAANYVAGDGIYVVADPEDGASTFFYRLGMEIDPDILALDPQAVGRVHLSFEQVGLLDADFLGVLTNGADPAELPGWEELNAVRNGSLVDFSFADVVGINTPTPLSMPYEIDLLRPALEAVAAP
jgi:iron complex transport system substrate-binding protein